jgi:hypothetical protein
MTWQALPSSGDVADALTPRCWAPGRDRGARYSKMLSAVRAGHETVESIVEFCAGKHHGLRSELRIREFVEWLAEWRAARAERLKDLHVGTGRLPNSGEIAAAFAQTWGLTKIGAQKFVAAILAAIREGFVDVDAIAERIESQDPDRIEGVLRWIVEWMKLDQERPQFVGPPLAEGLDDEMLMRLVNAGAASGALSSAFKVRLVDIQRRLRFLGFAREIGRTSMNEDMPRPDLDALWPLLSRMRPSRVVPPGRPARPVERLRESVKVEIARLETELAEALREREELRARLVDRDTIIAEGIQHWPSLAAARGFHLELAGWIRERESGPAHPLRLVCEGSVRTIEDHVADLERPDLQAATTAVESLQHDLFYAKGLERSIESGAARSWLSLDVSVALGYWLRGVENGDLDDDDLQLLAWQWGWQGPDIEDQGLEARAAGDELNDREFAELLEAGADLEDPDLDDDFDPMMKLAVDQARGVGSWAPLPLGGRVDRDRRTTAAQHTRDTARVDGAARWRPWLPAKALGLADDRDAMLGTA